MQGIGCKIEDQVRPRVESIEQVKVNAMMAEKHVVIKNLISRLNEALYDREVTTSEMLKELRDKIDTLLKNDF